jgi:predicted lipoprotein with Yx(FWY)xxD motif
MQAARDLAPRVAGAGLLAAFGGIHLDLYLTGYRTIPVIGWLFLLQVIVTFALALAVLVLRRGLAAVAAFAAAGFALATLGGYFLSIWVGLFGFREVRTTAGVVAGILEIAAFAVLVPAGVLAAGAELSWLVPRKLTAAAKRTGRMAMRMVFAGTAVVALAAGGALAATEATATNAAPSAATTVLKIARVNGVTVLTNNRGFTVYTFAPDGTNRSACYGSCASYWPPVLGKPAAGPGVAGVLGTARRTDGTVQATYNGHPLYTYVGDSGPGQANGNGLNLNGGFWREARP